MDEMDPVIAAIVVDNGEPSLAECIESLRNQSVEVRVVVASGPKTDISLARRLADEVYPPIEGIGRARVNAILKERCEYILSCDSDCIYDRDYARYALENLTRGARAVKAGSILPQEWDPRAIPELLITLPIGYEFALAFRRSAFLEAGIHLEDYSYPRRDIGTPVMLRLMPVIDFRMKVYARMPTRNARIIMDYAPQLTAGTLPIMVPATAIGLSEIKNWGV